MTTFPWSYSWTQINSFLMNTYPGRIMWQDRMMPNAQGIPEKSGGVWHYIYRGVSHAIVLYSSGGSAYILHQKSEIGNTYKNLLIGCEAQIRAIHSQ